MRAKDQFIYKIWDIQKEKYFSTGKKSSWKSGTWAVAAVKDLNYYYANQSEKENTWERYEIHKMKLEVVEVYNVKDLLFVNADLEKQISNLEIELTYKATELSRVLGMEIPFERLRKMREENMLSEAAEASIVKIENEQTALRKKINELKAGITTI